MVELTCSLKGMIEPPYLSHIFSSLKGLTISKSKDKPTYVKALSRLPNLERQKKWKNKQDPSMKMEYHF